METMPQAAAAFGVFDLDGLDDLARWFDARVERGAGGDRPGGHGFDPGATGKIAATSR